jgi:antitoxin VapB
MTAVCRQIEEGESEFEIAGRMVGAMVSKGLDVPTCLVAVDDRAFEWRHFLPTNRRLDRYAALSICARDQGVVLSCTRLVHFGPLPEDLRLRIEAVCQIDAGLIAATRPGATSGQLFEVVRRAYARAGFPDEWRNHHQGGLAGYRGREWLATPDGKDVVAAGQLVGDPVFPGLSQFGLHLIGIPVKGLPKGGRSFGV